MIFYLISCTASWDMSFWVLTCQVEIVLKRNITLITSVCPNILDTLSWCPLFGHSSSWSVSCEIFPFSPCLVFQRSGGMPRWSCSSSPSSIHAMLPRPRTSPRALFPDPPSAWRPHQLTPSPASLKLNYAPLSMVHNFKKTLSRYCRFPSTSSLISFSTAGSGRTSPMMALEITLVVFG